ncbi:carbohydrate-binding protein [Kibdelosporangium aridum]|uniref:carbohydrate-binding protein n=1 Tax=Kibdelosporangium aridum TaxID=2030 RepID=UPI0035E94F00
MEHRRHTERLLLVRRPSDRWRWWHDPTNDSANDAADHAEADHQPADDAQKPPTTQPTKPTTSTQAPPANGAEWKPNTAYPAGAEVTFQGARYRIIQRHTSLPGWEPPATPALWKKL